MPEDRSEEIRAGVVSHYSALARSALVHALAWRMASNVCVFVCSSAIIFLPRPLFFSSCSLHTFESEWHLDAGGR